MAPGCGSIRESTEQPTHLLTIHEIIEEKIFYVELNADPKAKDIVLEGYQEHHRCSTAPNSRS
jgi:hypothetical protein